MKRLMIFISIVLSLFFIQLALAQEQTTLCVDGGIDYSSSQTLQVDDTGSGLKLCGPNETIIKVVADDRSKDRHLERFECAKAYNPSKTRSLFDSTKTYTIDIPGRGNYACPLNYVMDGVYYQDYAEGNNQNADDRDLFIHCKKLIVGSGIDYSKSVLVNVSQCGQESCVGNIPQGYVPYGTLNRYRNSGSVVTTYIDFGIGFFPVCGSLCIFPTIGFDEDEEVINPDAYTAGIWAAPLLPNQCPSPQCGNGIKELGEQCDDGNTNNTDQCSNSCELPDLCVENVSLVVVSDTSTLLANGKPSVLTYNQNPRWNASIPGAKWIWDEFKVSNPKLNKTVTFKKTFNVTFGAENLSAKIIIAADNSYSCKLNGNTFGDPSEINYWDVTKDTYNITNYINIGLNTLECQVKNWAMPKSTYRSNPAGLLYRIEVNYQINNCEQICGNGIKESPEQCDDGNSNNFDSCKNDCTAPVCGDGLINQLTEQCDDGNTNDLDACNNKCFVTFCGDKIKQTPNRDGQNEECDDGNFNNSDLCNNQCELAECGDGLINQPTEQCDDGNLINGDGCSNICNEEIEPLCGDGIINQPTEQCDDGNLNNNDSCKNDCTVPVCGNGILEFNEQCDDGNNINGDGCSNICRAEIGCIDVVKEAVDLNGNLINPVPQFAFILNNGAQVAFSDSSGHARFENVTPGLNRVNETLTAGWVLHSVTPAGGYVWVPKNGECATVLFKNLQNITNPFCGDGAVNQVGEQCDDGNNNNNDMCRNDCTVPFCGDQIVDVGEQCDDGNNNNNDLCRNNCVVPVCGDGQVDAGEQCDDGNSNDNDLCRNNCMITFCGDGQIDAGEQCDDGNNNNNDLCNNQCYITFCGDGNVNPGEECDDGNSNDDDLCRNNCVVPVCGDGILDSNEQCDDGNLINGDGCSNICDIEEAEPFCGDGNLDAGEACDDGNSMDGDGCSSICNIEDGCIEIVKEAIDIEGSLIYPTPQFTFSLNGGEQTVYNNNLGYAIFNNVTPGWNSVSEDLPFGWGLHSVTPAGGLVFVPSGNDCVTVLFKNIQEIEEPVCGDGTVNQPSEECDDGNSNNDDSCRNDCTLPFCGDQIVDVGEQCDDGNSNNNDLCNNQCQNTFCGDSVVNNGEQCDDGNGNNNDLCRNNCVVPVCGDGIKDSNEQCDDGNLINGDGCSNTCQIGIGCIDVVKETVDIAGDLINPVPQFRFTLNNGEQVAYSNSQGRARFNNVPAGVNVVSENVTFGWLLYSVTPAGGAVVVPESQDCVTVLFKNIQHIEPHHDHPVCGNNVLEMGEECDDGNLANGDGCSDICDIENPAPTLKQCNDGLDNDGDGYIDLNDFSCSSSSDDDETNPKSACQDGLDNDGDGLVDLADGGCNNTQDNSEVGGLVPPQCNDGLDNDSDGLVDLADPGCSSASDNDETNVVILSQCSDGIDNDSDGLTDLGDPGCSSVSDNDETNVLPPSPTNPQCNDGIDNDNDGAVDYQNDFSCTDANDNDEENPKSQCQDGIDNDGDGKIDLADQDCINNQDNVEKRKSSSGGSGGSSSNDDDDDSSNNNPIYIGSGSSSGQPSYLGQSSGNKILMPTGKVITLDGNGYNNTQGSDYSYSNKLGSSSILLWILIGLIILLILILIFLISMR